MPCMTFVKTRTPMYVVRASSAHQLNSFTDTNRGIQVCRPDVRRAAEMVGAERRRTSAVAAERCVSRLAFFSFL